MLYVDLHIEMNVVTILFAEVIVLWKLLRKSYSWYCIFRHYFIYYKPYLIHNIAVTLKQNLTVPNFHSISEEQFTVYSGNC
jgi:hypothetical protein